MGACACSLHLPASQCMGTAQGMHGRHTGHAWAHVWHRDPAAAHEGRAGCQVPAAPAGVRAAGRSEQRRVQGAISGAQGQGKGLPPAARPQGPRLLLWPGVALAGCREPLIKAAGAEGAGLGEQRPWPCATSLPALLPWEFVKQISLIAQAEEVVGEKRWEIPLLWASSFPLAPGAVGGEQPPCAPSGLH